MECCSGLENWVENWDVNCKMIVIDERRLALFFPFKKGNRYLFGHNDLESISTVAGQRILYGGLFRCFFLIMIAFVQPSGCLNLASRASECFPNWHPPQS